MGPPCELQVSKLRKLMTIHLALGAVVQGIPGDFVETVSRNKKY